MYLNSEFSTLDKSLSRMTKIVAWSLYSGNHAPTTWQLDQLQQHNRDVLLESTNFFNWRRSATKHNSSSLEVYPAAVPTWSAAAPLEAWGGPAACGTQRWAGRRRPCCSWPGPPPSHSSAAQSTRTPSLGERFDWSVVYILSPSFYLIIQLFLDFHYFIYKVHVVILPSIDS